MSTITAPRPSSIDTNLPGSEYVHEGRLKIVIAGLDKNVRNEAARTANDVLKDKTSGGGNFLSFLRNIKDRQFTEAGRDIRSFGRRLRYGTLGQEYYQNKYRQEKEKEIVERGDFKDRYGEDYESQITMRFAHEFDDLVHTEAGERRTKLDFETNPDGTTNEKGVKLKENLFGLIKEATLGGFDDESGNLNEESFNEEKKRVITESANDGLTEDYIGASMLWADNILQIVNHSRAAILSQNITDEAEKTAAIENMFENTDIILGEARLGARGEVKKTAAERISEKLSKCDWLNEETVATSAAVALTAASFAVKRGASRLAASIAVPGVTGGVWAAKREYVKLDEERTDIARKMATGEVDMQSLSGRTAELAKTVYETRSASELKDQISVLYNDDGELRIDDADHFKEAISIIAEIQARNRLSDQKDINLISYSSVEMVEKERFELDLALAKSKTDIQKLLSSSSDTELKAFGLGDETIAELKKPDANILNVIMEPQIEGAQGVMEAAIERLQIGEEANDEESINARDRLFNKMRRSEVMKAFLKGTAIGSFLGLFAQEVVTSVEAAAGESTSSLLIENQGATKESWLRSVLDHGNGALDHGNYEYVANANPENTILVNDETKIVLPDGFTIEPSADGTEAILSGNGVNIEHLKLTSQGTLTDESLNQLHEAGFSTEVSANQISEDVDRQVAGESARDFIDNHSDEAVTVKRDFWYDNDTTSIYEGSELDLQDPVIQSDGSINISISGIKESGTHAGNYAELKELAKNGELKIALSLSKGTQSEVFLFNVDENGNAIIPSDSPCTDLFNKGENGQLSFDGQYTEVVQVHGIDENGITHISPFATNIGSNLNSFDDTVTDKVTYNSTTYTLNLTENVPGTEVEAKTIIPSALPLNTRRGLEYTDANKATPIESYYFSNIAEDRRRIWAENRSPRLQEKPNTLLNTGEELKWYRDELKQFDEEYIKEIDGHLKGNEDVLRRLDSNITAEVCISVAAAEDSESIYDTLVQYAQQDTESQKSTMFFLNIHWMERLESDPEQMSKIQKTFTEIEQAMSDFPNLNIVGFETVWPDELIQSLHDVNDLYDESTKRLYDTAALATEQAIRKGHRTNRAGAIIINSDVGATNLGHNLIRNFVKEANRHPRIDVFSTIDRDEQSGLPTASGFRLSAYAATGGSLYLSDMSININGAIDQLIAAARQGDSLHQSADQNDNRQTNNDTQEEPHNNEQAQVENNAPANNQPSTSGAPQQLALSSGTTNNPYQLAITQALANINPNDELDEITAQKPNGEGGTIYADFAYNNRKINGYFYFTGYDNDMDHLIFEPHNNPGQTEFIIGREKALSLIGSGRIIKHLQR